MSIQLKNKQHIYFCWSYSFLFSGQVCCALYELDLQYYRGKVLSVRESGEKLVQVQYVDYGNSEWHSPDR